MVLTGAAIMTEYDVIVIGGGISGLSAAWHAARDGRRVLVLEQSSAPGGCLSTRREESGFWFEMGAHTTYNSYGGMVALIRGVGLEDAVVQRGPARIHFGLLEDGRYTWLTPYKVLLRLGWLEAAWRFPLRIWSGKSGRTVADYYSRLLGPRNFRRVLAPFFAAVPSQPADAFPVEGQGSLFKKRPRCTELPRSFGLEGGLQTLCDALAEASGIETRLNAGVTRISRDGQRLRITLGSGETLEAPRGILATPLPVTRALLAASFPKIAEALEPLDTVEIESLGVSLDKEACPLPECAFVVPVDDLFYSMVTRDPFPDPDRRGFCFHFQAGVPREQQLARMSDVLQIPAETLGSPAVRRTPLPSPRVGHADIVARIDAALEGEPLGVTGNFFAGLAIEDCISRSVSEWCRLAREA